MTVERKTGTGGYYSLNNQRYWIPPELYDQVSERDDSTPLTVKGDREFGKWLSDFVKNHGLVPEDTNTRRLSKYWALPWNESSTNTSPKIVKMATVERAMRTVASVVDPSHSLRVGFDESVGTSYWSKDQVKLPTQPVQEIADLDECINVMAGFTTHEAFHSLHTRPLLESATDENDYNEFMKDSWNKLPLNLVEDNRIEWLGLQDTPGYRDYLNFVGEYLWNDHGHPTKWPDSPQERLQTAITILRYGDREADILTDPSFDGPRKWLNDWNNRYMQEQGSAPSFDIAKAYVEEFKKFIDVLPGDKAPEKVNLVCAAVGQDEGITRDEAGAIQDAIESEVESITEKEWERTFGEPHKGTSLGAEMSTAVVLKPRVLGKYTPAKADLVQKAKSAIMLKHSLPQHDTRLMKSGQLDEDELYRMFALKDMRIFKDATVDSMPEAAVYLLIDMSGSMGSPGDSRSSSYYATRMAEIFVEALSKHPNVKVKVLGHTGDNDACRNGGAFYRIWEPGDSRDRLHLMYEVQYGDNYDGFAIAWAGEMLRKESAEQKMLIVLADGWPAGYGYGGEPAVLHVRSHSDRLERAGIRVVQMAISTELDEASQAKMFKHYVMAPIEAGGDVVFRNALKGLTKLLRKVV